MKPFLHQKLLAGLLLELCNEGYETGNRFLSRRQICQLWAVSTPTTETALRSLVDLQLLEPQSRSGFRVRHGFRRKALYLFNQGDTESLLPLKTSWPMKAGWLTGKNSNDLERIAVIFDGYQYGSVLPVANPEYLEPCSLLCAQGCLDAATSEQEIRFFALSPKNSNLKSLQGSLAKGQFSGAVVFQRNGRERGTQPLIKAISDQNLPVVCAFSPAEKTQAIAIDINNIQVGSMAGSIFISNSRTKIAGCIPPYADRRSIDRIRGLQRAVEDAKASFSTLRMDRSGNLVKSALATVLDPKKRPDAIFFPGHHDFAQLGKIFEDAGIQIPRDLSLIMTSSLSYAPGLGRDVDIMKIDFREVGFRAVTLMQDVISRRTLHTKLTLVNLEYIANGTVKKL